MNSARAERRLLPVGVTREKLFWEKGPLLLQGAGRTRSVLSWGDGAFAPGPDGHKLGTFRSYTAFLGGPSVCVRDLTVENTAGPGQTAGQAVAVYADAALVYMENVCLRSRQDTLFCAPLPATEREEGGFRGPREHSPRRPSVQYYRNCQIEGDVDFIFGGADVLFDGCEIKSLSKDQLCNGYTAAPSGPADGLGMVFLGCRFTTDTAADGSVYLARPWRPSGKAAFLQCQLGAHIAPALFSPWEPGFGKEKADFCIWQCSGPGLPAEREMAPMARALSDQEAETLLCHADKVRRQACEFWQQPEDGSVFAIPPQRR